MSDDSIFALLEQAAQSKKAAAEVGEKINHTSDYVQTLLTQIDTICATTKPAQPTENVAKENNAKVKKLRMPKFKLPNLQVRRALVAVANVMCCKVALF